MLSNYKNSESDVEAWSSKDIVTWENSFPPNIVFVNKGKHNDYVLRIIASLALIDPPNTTRDLAKFLLKKSKKYPYKPIRDKEARSVEKSVREHITGTKKIQSGKKKSEKTYPSLITNNFVRIIGKKINSKGNEVNFYSLTFTGFLFSLGFDFNDEELGEFLKNAARHHIFFAYVQKILHNTSIPFIKRIFIQPIFEIIQKKKVLLDEGIAFYFSNIVESIGKSLNNLGDEVKIDGFNWYDEFDEKYLPYVEEIIKCTYYEDRPTSDWYNAMVDIFYTDEESREFYLMYSPKGLEKNFLFKLMQKIHLVYFGYGGNNVPRKTQRVPISSIWKKDKKYNPELTTPREYDKKRKIMIRYDADHIPS